MFRGTANSLLQRWVLRAACVCALLAGALPAFSQQDVRAVRAAYIYNLTKYVTWENQKSHITVCYFGEKSMGRALEGVLNGKYSDNRVIRVVPYTSASALERCDVLYVSGLAPEDDRAMLDRVRGRKILTIGDTDAFARRGGIIGLVRTGDQVQLDINVDAAAAAGLQISSRVLNLAVIVHSMRSDRP